jgi:hypothetical protein
LWHSPNRRLCITLRTTGRFIITTITAVTEAITIIISTGITTITVVTGVITTIIMEGRYITLILPTGRFRDKSI